MTTPRTPATKTSEKSPQSKQKLPFYQLKIMTGDESKRSPLSPTPGIRVIPISNSSTRCSLARLGFHRELSRLQKLLLLFCGIMAAYEAFSPAEKAANDFMGYMIPPDEITRGISKCMAGIISFIIMFSTFKGMGKGLRNLEQYSARLDAQGEQLAELIKTASAQDRQLIELNKTVEKHQVFIEKSEKQMPMESPVVSLQPALFAVRLTSFSVPAPETPTEKEESQGQDTLATTPRQGTMNQMFL